MSGIDWIILVVVLGGIVGYGSWVTRKRENLNSYLLGDTEAKWWTVGLSVMATQASAITFLSTPGQAYHDGMGFVQFYFGLPIAMVIICLFFIPIYKRLKVYTAYEYLEGRFDLKTRSLTAVLFLIQRGLAAGITIYAPAIVLSTVLGWNLKLLVILIGVLVIIYTVSGGSKAVNITQKYQMGIIFLGMFIAFYLILNKLPDNVGFSEAMQIAGLSGKMDILDFSFNLENRYTFWSGIIGGTFLALSYFGTDQSQVQRYLTGASIRESQFGLLFNGFLKVPMQFFILLTGVMVFVFFQFQPSPVFFNPKVIGKALETDCREEIQTLNNEFDSIYHLKKELFISGLHNENIPKLKEFTRQEKEIRDNVKSLISVALPKAETNDKDFVFIYFILNHFPKGLIGLLLAVFFCAAMSSTASELNALASTTTVDIFKRSMYPHLLEEQYVTVSRGFTILWGLVAILFGCFGTLFENLIQFVNIIGSIFYGTILGIFLVGFFIKYVKANAMFIAALISEFLVIIIWYFDLLEISYLWLNLVGCTLTISLAIMMQLLIGQKRRIAK